MDNWSELGMAEEIEDHEIDEICIRALDVHRKVFKRLSEI